MSESNKVLLYAVSKGYHINLLGNIVSPSGKIRATDIDSRGYYRFTVKHEGKYRAVFVHRLVAYKKYGDMIFNKGIQVRHLNNNKLDCSLENIAIGSGHDNAMDNPKDVRINRAKAGAMKLRKFTDSEVEEIRNLNKNGIGIRKLSKDYNVAKSTLSYIINRKTYNN